MTLIASSRLAVPASSPISRNVPREHYLTTSPRSRGHRLPASVLETVAGTTATFWAARGVRSIRSSAGAAALDGPAGTGTDSMQFVLELACRMAPRGCYSVTPSVRSELIDAGSMRSSGHVEAEIPGTLDAAIGAVEQYVGALGAALLADDAAAIRAVAGTVRRLERLAVSASLPRLTFAEAIRILDTCGGEVAVDPIRGFRTLPRASEQLLTEHCGGLVWLTHADHLAVPFYQATDGGATALTADLLVDQGRAVSAGQRHRTGDEVLDALDRHGMSRSHYEWYAQMKDEDPLTTSGFGLDLGAFVHHVLNHDVPDSPR